MGSLFDTVWPKGLTETEVFSHTSSLGAELDAYLTEIYGEDAIVGGHLAVDDEGHILDIRVYVHGVRGIDEQVTMPHGDGRTADDDRRAWIADTPDATRSMTFVRRPHNLPWVARPLGPDEHVFRVTGRQAEQEEGYEYIGHIITNGSHHGMMVNDAPPEERALSHVMEHFSELPDELKAMLTAMSGKALAESMPEVMTPDVQSALEAAQRFYANGEKPSDEEVDAVDRALRQLETKLAEMDAAEVNGTKRKNPMDVPDINPRPNVPPAFYN